MPPAQCPECGRFLANALVAGLEDAPAPCPKCGTELTIAMFGGGTPAEVVEPAERDPAPAAAPDDEPPPPPVVAEAAGRTPVAADEDAPPVDAPATSVRPPDLQPDEVRDGDDVLAGWDAGVPVGLAAVRDERPFPVDTAVVAGAAAVGFAVGAFAGRQALRHGLLGALGGAVGAGIARRIWQLP